MTAGEMVQEVFNRGFHFLDDSGTEEARVLTWVNAALTEIYEEADWPFLEITATGAAPLALTRARNVESVVNTTDGMELDWLPRRRVMDLYGTPPAGTPRYWYVEHTATDTMTVNVAPTAADTLSVRFFQHQDTQVVANTPILPARWHWLAVEGAVRRAYIDSDDYASAAQVEQYRQGGLVLMKRALLAQGKPSPNIADIKEQDLVTEAGQRIVKGGEQ